MIGKKAKITQDKQTENGMLYKGTKVVVKDKKCSCQGDNNIMVEHAGRRYWVSNSDILVI